MKNVKADPLARYKAKRDFAITPEPLDNDTSSDPDEALVFVVQKHWASRLHYDFRLQLDGAMKSWAVPKGPSFDPADKRLAMHVEDHPMSYNSFQGEIPTGQYGAGKVIIWDQGTWTPLADARKGYAAGKLSFELHGHKLQGRWALVRMKGRAGKQDPWMLIKEKDGFVQPADQFSVVDEMPDSVVGIAQPPTRKVITALPQRLDPVLATLVDSPPRDSGAWLYEIKFDGYRLLTRIDKKQISFWTRNHNDWTPKLLPLKKFLAAHRLPDGWYDGEIVVLNEQGLPDFQALQRAFDDKSPASIVYYLFDLPFCDGEDLRDRALVDRRNALEAVLDKAGITSIDDAPVRFSASFQAPGRDIAASACQMGLEGIIGKRKTSLYTGRRSPDWIKLKCSLRQEFVIGGYTPPQGSRRGFGSLLLGVYDNSGQLQYSGNVGTGFNQETLDTVHRQLTRLHAKHSPYADGKPIPYRTVQWLQPLLVAEVSFAQWTKDGRVRHAVFHGLRSDKPARDIGRETAATNNALTLAMDKIKITHPKRVIDPSIKATKEDLLRYYALVAPLMMDHLRGRPVSFLKAPDGITKNTFFQKHMQTGKLTGLRQLPKKLDPEHDPLVEVSSETGLFSAAQMNVVEFHTWNAVKTAISRPDRMVFDLDPGKGASWEAMQEAALLLQAFLTELELVPFIKTSGGKGLHVVVPLQRRHDWDSVKAVSHAIVLHLTATFPKRFSAKSGPRNRVGKIFIDYLRNGFGATTVCAWSVRAREGLAVSVPIQWDEVPSLPSASRWHIGNAHERLAVGNSPWKDYKDSARTLTIAKKKLQHSTG